MKYESILRVLDSPILNRVESSFLAGKSKKDLGLKTRILRAAK